MTGDNHARQQHRLDDQRAVDALLAEAGCGDDAALRDLLLQLRSLRTDEVPAPSEEVAALLASPSGTVARLDPGRPRRNRRFVFTALGVAASLGVAGGAAAGNEDLRRGAEGTVKGILRSFSPPAPPAPAAPAPGPGASSPAPAVVPVSPETLPAGVPAAPPAADPAGPEPGEISGPAEHMATFHPGPGMEGPATRAEGQNEHANPAVPAKDSREPAEPPAASQAAEVEPGARPGRNGNGAVPGGDQPAGQPSEQPDEPGDKTNPSR